VSRPRPTAAAPLAVVLAAGVGRRLGELTAARPKAMIEVGGVPLLERTLSALEASGFQDVLVVTGHCAEVIDEFLAYRRGSIQTRTLFNPKFAEANNVVSLLVAEEELYDGFCLLNSDIVFDRSLLADVRSNTGGVSLVVDGDEPLGPEEMKVELDGRGFVRRISKSLEPADSAGEYIGIARFDAASTGIVLEAAKALVAAGRVDLYYEDAIDASASALDARIITTDRRKWTEIDDLADFERAQRVAAELDRVAAA